MRVRAGAIGAVMALLPLACGPVTVTPSGSPPTVAASASSGSVGVASPTAADAWSVVSLAQPAAVTEAPSLQPGYHCSPCHPAAASQLAGIASTAAGTIAVGVQQPPARAIALLSRDTRSWQDLPGFDPAEGTGADAVASAADRTVIVGRSDVGATAWTSTGQGWSQAPDQPSLRVPLAAGAMLSVTAFRGSFVAGGYRDDPAHAAASAAIWRSADGLTWQSEDAASFRRGRIWGVAATGGDLVAVGTTGDPNYGPAAAWYWTAAGGWQPASITPSPAGAMRAVVAGTSGFVAVGLDGDDRGALAWTSSDGRVWTAIPDATSLHYYTSPIRMQSIAALGSGYLAGGWRSDAGNGSAVAWTSRDGITWTQTPWQPSFSGGEMTGVAATAGTILAVGRTGYPDNNQATIWQGSEP